MEIRKKTPTMTSQIMIRVFICLGVLIVGFIGMTGLASLKKPPAEAKVEERALRVEIAEIEAVDIPVTITAYGEVTALNTVAVSPEVAGRVTGVHPRLEVGEILLKNDTMFHIDVSDYRAAYDASAATAGQLKMAIQRLKKQQEIDTGRLKTLERNRELAGAEFERLRTLFTEHQVGTRSGMDQAEQAYNAAVDQVDQMAQAIALYPFQIQEQKSGLAAAEAGLTQAQTNLDRCVVRAPFSGRITAVSIETNQYVAPGQSVVTLADDSVLEIQLPIDSRDARQWLQFDRAAETSGSGWISGLKPVDCRILWTEDKDGDGWIGRLHRVVKFEPRTRTLTVAVRIDAPSAAGSDSSRLPLVEGMFCEVRIPGRTLEHVYRVPRKVVNLDQTVYAAKDNRLHTVAVTVVRYEGESALISLGLSDGDQIIITRLVDPLENSLLKITN